MMKKILYGALFTVVLPILLILWAKYTSGLIELPVPLSGIYGAVIAISGLLVLLAGMLQLWIHGKGLPMNAFPPKKYVTNGVYSLTKHPIYAGAIIISFGVSIFFGSTSGFWLISPVFTLMIIVFIAGFEKEHIQSIYGNQQHITFFSIPEHTNEIPKFSQKLSALLQVFVPWIIIYETFVFIGRPSDALITNFKFESQIPVWDFFEIFYLLTYPFICLVPFIIKKKSELRNFIFDSLTVMTISFFCFLVFPFITEYRSISSSSVFKYLINFERGFDSESAAFPSFHVIWGFMAAYYFTVRFKKFFIGWYLLASLILLSCIFTGNHSIIDVLAGFMVFLAGVNRIKIWNWIRNVTEHISNSWKEWNFGKIRLINHGFYAGISGFIGFLIIGSFIGDGYIIFGFIISLLAIIGAGLWAQIIEGSHRLLRPYGYYGSVVGVLAGSLLVSIIFGIQFFSILASFCLAAPMIQLFGRFRCLVQGCCHGKQSNPLIGIKFIHPNSRVLKLADLKGVPIHPTQLYSIVNNLIAAFILFRFQSLQLPTSFIAGMYFILNGLGRFVEEAYRGEPQTPYWAGMRIYQWIAIINITLGAVFTTIPTDNFLVYHFNFQILIFAIITGIISIVAYGVDFPKSNRRFARLTS